MKIKAVRGMKDLLPDDTSVWQRLENDARHALAFYGYREIRPPILEAARLFTRTIGEGTDIVSKEMYTFKDKGGDEVTLRPEATASIMRAYVEHHLDQKTALAKLYCLGPMFRTERPQAGRQRQFHQLSTEAIGSASPFVDSEVIVMLADLLKRAGLSEFTVHLGTVGCPSCRQGFVRQLKDFVKTHRDQLGSECRERYPERVWRILDCKNEVCRGIMRKGPSLLETIRTSGCDCHRHFESVQEGLREAQQAFEIDPFLVRGLDYYTKTAFEVTAAGLGAQDAVAAGGRYDGLSRALGGPDVGGVGMAIGLERLLLSLRKDSEDISSGADRAVYLAPLGAAALTRMVSLARELRMQSVTVHMSYEAGRSLKSQLREADRLRCRWVVMLGDREMEKDIATVKDLREGEQAEWPLRELASKLSLSGAL